MDSVFKIITEDFITDIEAMRSLLTTIHDAHKSPKIRVAAANSTTLLLAATFEEFVREMAREYARAVVTNTTSFEKLPSKLASSAWKRTMDGLSKLRFDGDYACCGTENVFGAAQARFTVIYNFCKGDLTQDIYRDLIHNENNMRPGELNGLFKLSGLGDVCMKLSDKQSILNAFGEAEPGKAHGKLISWLDNFFERRNTIAHALNPGQSSGSTQIGNDISMLESFGNALCETIDASAPKSATGQPEHKEVAMDAAEMVVVAATLSRTFVDPSSAPVS